jgi:beta-fructofuranosidase
MNFAPAAPDRVLHDTWVFVHDEHVHLFYLAMQVGNNQHRLIGHAVSSDWLHWEELPYIDLAGPEGSWDAGRVGTGHTFRGTDGRFYMAYTGRIDPQEDVGLAVSDDLIHWSKVRTTPVWPQSLGSPYESDFRERGVPQAWRDPFVTTLPDGGRYALLCAKRGDGPLAARACVAVARVNETHDWTTLPPLATPPLFSTMEVPEVFEMAGRWWLTFNAHGGWGRRLDTATRDDTGGSYYLVADEPFGEWRVPKDSLLIGSGKGRHDAVVARSVVFGGERLVYHHYTGSGETGSARALGLPKVLVAVEDRLVLRPWCGLRGIQRPATRGDWCAPARGPCSSGTWEMTGASVRGECAQGAATCVAELSAPDVDIACEIWLEGAARAGIGVAGGGGDGLGAATVLLDAQHGLVSVAELRAGVFGPVLDPTLDDARREVRAGQVVPVRILKRGRYVEVFVEDELVFSTIWRDSGRGTSLVLVVDGGKAEFRLAELHGLEPMGGWL